MKEYQIIAEIEGLLYEDESSTLDFKKEQYPFNKSNDDQKSELLKDILAFANAWRRADAFIIIGVEEVKGNKGNLVGVSDDLDDACLQQFVNSKTQRPITFEYRSAILEEKRIGIIRIPLQTRPIYLKKDFGKLRANVVYIRRGSSTAEADPDEIARMGQAISEVYRNQPDFKIEFAQDKKRARLGTELKLETIKLLIPDKKAIPDYSESGNSPFMPSLGMVNRDFYRELINYYYWKHIRKYFTFFIENISDSAGLGIKIVVEIPKSEGFGLLSESQIPWEPHKSLDIPRMNGLFRNNILNKSDSTISESANNWIIEIEISRLQPKSSYFTQHRIVMYAEKDVEKELNVTIYSDNLAIPIKNTLFLKASVIEKPGDLATIKNMYYQMMRERRERKI